MADSYPNLDKSLKGIIVAGYFTDLRRLDTWTWGLGAGVAATFLVNGAYWGFIPALAVGYMLTRLAGGYRRKDYSMAAAISEASKDHLPRRMRSWLKRGRLQELLSEEVLDSLEQCAKSSWEPQVFVVEARMLKTGVSSAYLKAQEEASKAADGMMRQALYTVQRALTFRTDMSEAEIGRLDKLRDDLQLLESESRSLSEISDKVEESQELSDSLAHIRALKAAVEEVEADSE